MHRRPLSYSCSRGRQLPPPTGHEVRAGCSGTREQGLILTTSGSWTIIVIPFMKTSREVTCRHVNVCNLVTSMPQTSGRELWWQGEVRKHGGTL